MTGKRKRILFAVLAVAGTLVLIEACCFVAVRALAEQPDPERAQTHLFDAHRNHRLNPTFQLSTDPGSRLHSEDGFRQETPVAIQKPERTLRIIALGTSALYGNGAGPPYPPHPPLRNDETITFHLEQRIRQQLQADGIEYGVEIVNAAVSAYRTFHHLVYLNASLLDYEPDIVINVDGHNDFYLEAPTDRWNGYAYSTSILVDEFNGRTMFLPYMTFVRSLAPYSNAFNLLERVNKRVWSATRVEKRLPHTPHRRLPSAGDAEANIRAAARRTYLSDLWQIHQLGRYAGFDHYVFLQPEIVFEPDESLSEADRALKRITLDSMPADRADLMQRIRGMLPELFAEQDIPFDDVADLAAHAEPGTDLYIDYCHLSPDGARVAAERIFERLYPRVLAKIRAADANPSLTTSPKPPVDGSTPTPAEAAGDPEENP